jgi:hypothetical protein
MGLRLPIQSLVKDTAEGWTLLMTGIASLILAILGFTTFYEKVTPAWAFWATAALCVPAALIRAWWVQYKSRTAMQEQLDAMQVRYEAMFRPRFVFNVGQVLTGYSPDITFAFVAVPIMIINQGADSAALLWRVTYSSPNHTTDARILKLRDGEKVLNHSAGQVTLFETDNIVEKSLAPIPRGGTVSGQLYLEIEGPNGTDIFGDGKESLTILVRDYLGGEHKATLSQGSPASEYTHLPGQGSGPGYSR